MLKYTTKKTHFFGFFFVSDVLFLKNLFHSYSYNGESLINMCPKVLVIFTRLTTDYILTKDSYSILP